MSIKCQIPHIRTIKVHIVFKKYQVPLVFFINKYIYIYICISIFVPTFLFQNFFPFLLIVLLFQITHTKTNTNIHARGGIRTSNPLDQASRVRPCLHALSHPDRLNLNEVGRPRDLNPGPPECESRAKPRSHLARFLVQKITNPLKRVLPM